MPIKRLVQVRRLVEYVGEPDSCWRSSRGAAAALDANAEKIELSSP